MSKNLTERVDSTDKLKNWLLEDKVKRWN